MKEIHHGPPRIRSSSSTRTRGGVVLCLGMLLVAMFALPLSAQEVDPGTGPSPLPAPSSVTDPLTGSQETEGQPSPMAPPAATESVNPENAANIPPFDAGYLDSLIKQGDWPEAERLTDAYHHAPTALRIAWHYYDQGDYLFAINWFDLSLRWLRDFPGDQQEGARVYPSAVYGRALSLYKEGRVEEAESFARQNVRVDDKIAALLADILIQKAGNYLANKEPRMALNFMDEARPLRSAGFTASEMLIEAWANYNLGWENLQQFQKTKEAYYKEVAQPYLDNAAAIFLKTFPLIDSLSSEEERERIRQSALEGLARTEYARGNYQEAYRIVNSPNFTGEVADRVRAEIRAGVLAAIYNDLTPQQKLQYLEGLRQRTPLTAEQTLEHGMMYLELKQYSTAARIFEYLLNQTPPPDIAARAAMGLSFASNELHDYARARSAAEQALRLRFYLEGETVKSLDSMLLSMDAQMAVAAYNARDYQAALTMLERVRRQRPLNLGERSVEAWSNYHLGRAALAYTLFEPLYRDVREVRKRVVQWDPSLPEYLRPQSTYIPDTGPDPLPQAQQTPSFPVPPELQTTPAGTQPYGYSYPGQVQPYTSPAPQYYYQQPTQAPAQPQTQPQQYYLPPSQAPAPVPNYYNTPPIVNPPGYGSPASTEPFGYNYGAPYGYPPQPQYNPRGQKHPLMQNLFDLPEGVLPPTLTQALAQTMAESQSTGEPPLPHESQYAAPGGAAYEQESLFGQGDGEEPPVVNERFARDFLKNEYGMGMENTSTANPAFPGNQPTAYPTPPQAAQNQPDPSAQGNLPSFETLMGHEGAASVPPSTPVYSGEPATLSEFGAPSGYPPTQSPYINPAQPAGPGYYPTQPPASQAAQSGVNPQFDNLLKTLTQQGGTVTASSSTTTTTTAPVTTPAPSYNYTFTYNTPLETAAVTEANRSARPVIVEPDISYPGEPYVPKLSDLAKGLYASASRSDQLPRVRLLAQEVGGPLAAEVALGLRSRKLYLEVQKHFLAVEPNLENYDTGRLTGAVRMRTKSGTSGLGELDVIQFPVITYEGYSPFNSDKTRFAAEGSMLYLDSGSRDSNAAFGRFPEAAPERLASSSQEDPVYDFRIKFWEEDWTAFFVEAGMSPINGPVDATPIGRLGMTQNLDRGYWRAELFRDSKRESVLSWIGEVDPYSGEAWGRVAETGVSAEFLWSLRDEQGKGDNLFRDRDISVFGKGTLGFLSGEGVAENTHLGLTLAIQRSFETDSFDFLLGGIGFSAEHYEKNLSQFTYGHGGYFSPQQLLQAQLFVQFLTHEGYQHLIGGQASVGFQTNRQDEAPFFPLDPDGRNYPSERTTSSIAQAYLSAAFLMDPQWKFTVQAGAAATATYDEFFGGFLFTYYFEPRKGLYSSDLSTPFVNQY